LSWNANQFTEEKGRRKVNTLLRYDNISAEFDEVSKTLSVEFFEDFGDVNVKIEDAAGNVVLNIVLVVENGTTYSIQYSSQSPCRRV
jgi:hypothetical protein